MSFTSIPSPKYGLDKISGRTIEVLVGKDREVFSVHEKLICAKSPFFEKALSGAWVESSTRTVELPEDEPRTFQFYIFWLYYDSLPVYDTSFKWDFSKDVNLLSLVKAYVLGDKLLDTGFQDATIDFIIEGRYHYPTLQRWLPVGEVIEYTYENTCKSSPIRKLFVDMYALGGHAEWLTDPSWGDSSQVLQPFLFDLAFKQTMDTTMYRRTPRSQIEPSRYHLGIHVADDEENSSERYVNF